MKPPTFLLLVTSLGVYAVCVFGQSPTPVGAAQPEQPEANDDAKSDSFSNDHVTFWEYKLSLSVMAWASPIIVVVGITGNIIVIAVLAYKGEFTSTSIYLINLGAADLAVCVVGQLCRVMPRALTGLDTNNLHPYICKTWFFINHSAKTISGWTLVAVTIERTLVVYLPFKARELCTNFRAKMALVAINVLCTVCYLHYFWSYGRKYEVRGNSTVLVAGCTIANDYPSIKPYMTYVRPWQDFIVRSAAPFACLLVCNILIIGKLFSERIKRRAMAGGSQQAAGQDDGQMASMTAMLLTVSFAHLLCISPMQIMYLVDKIDPFGKAITKRSQAIAALRWAFAIDIYYANHALNFLLYCISGRTFRNQVKEMFARMPGFRSLCKTETANRSSVYSDRTHSVTTVSSDVERKG